jgi:hypothetical protein
LRQGSPGIDAVLFGGDALIEEHVLPIERRFGQTQFVLGGEINGLRIGNVLAVKGGKHLSGLSLVADVLENAADHSGSTRNDTGPF